MTDAQISSAARQPGSPTTPVVVARDLRKRYGTVQAVDGVSFEIAEGEVFGILGPNGAGKTTTLEMIEGMRSIDSGSAMVDGVDVSADPAASSRGSGSSSRRPASSTSSTWSSCWICSVTSTVDELTRWRCWPMSS